MKTLTLERFCYSEQGTFGRLQCTSQAAFYTVEQPWADNKPFHSCVPEGKYQCKRYASAKYPNTFELTEVKGRTAILFHVGNTKDDFQGCIGLGTALSVVTNKWAVTGSGAAFKEFMAYLTDDNEFRLVITQYKP